MQHLVPLDLAPSASTAGSATARRRALAGATISTMRASRRPSPFPDWLQPLREEAAAFAGIAAGRFRPRLLARYDPGAGIGWHRDRDVFEEVVGISLGTPATLRFRHRTRRRVPPRQARACATLGLSACRAKRAGTGSTASRRAMRFASPSRSGPCPTRAARSRRPKADGTVRVAERFCAHALRVAVAFAASRPVRRGASRPARRSAEARSLGAEWALVNEQAAQASSPRPTSTRCARAFASSCRPTPRR